MIQAVNDERTELPWTGERVVPQIDGDAVLEHLHRYALALELARGKVVLDIACGEGYGSYLLGAVAERVIGVDVAPEVIAHARRAYPGDNLTFLEGSCTAIPLDDGAVDLVVSFETLEHIAEHEVMMAEVRRVLRPGGALLLSTPDKRTYSDLPHYTNPFHVRELYLEQFEQLLRDHFRNVWVWGQRIVHGSVVAPVRGRPGPGGGRFLTCRGDFSHVARSEGMDDAIYLLAVASDSEGAGVPLTGLFEGRGLHTEVEKAVASLRESAGALRLEVDSLGQQLAQRHAERDQAVAQLNQRAALLSGELEASRRRVADLEASLSWRVTAPLRATLALARRAAGRVTGTR
jgi:hypothetical protein